MRWERQNGRTTGAGDRDVITINQQHVYSKLAYTLSLAVGASSRLSDRPLIYDMIVSAMCLRGKHKSTSPLLNTRTRQGYHPEYTAKNVLSSGVQPVGS